jgi:hypothetical protein
LPPHRDSKPWGNFRTKSRLPGLFKPEAQAKKESHGISFACASGLNSRRLGQDSHKAFAPTDKLEFL